ncbi:transposase [Leeuwenhoekiella marinoflava]|uniref:Mutator family transposase n=2 Tax=Leeuwenhoekiella marinoflava TaxID=988 RepID=A0A4Q0PMJ3_9FLAO|nr:transposase [Leeuwenhoekiella marinoflava]RXG29924.1 mutator family transposase [Leeuwenhoekiella marinoflava]SHF26142.1 Transposase, Mutator family [Leeuwenhoekiella marinoflava DSM 3653]
MVKEKKLKSGFDSFDIETPQDRQSSFEPELVKKRQTILADNLSEKIISLHGLGLSYRDIFGHIKELYDTDILNISVHKMSLKLEENKAYKIRWC